MADKKVSKNFRQSELECPHCGILPSPGFIEKLQEFRDAYGQPMRITSGFRCKNHNRDIGGFEDTAHKVKIKGKSYGCVDFSIGRYYNRDRWNFVIIALKLRFNNIEVCDLHGHLGFVPDDHSQFEKFVWGESK